MHLVGCWQTERGCSGGKCGVRNPQTTSGSSPNMVGSPANRPGGRGDRRGYSRPARRDVPPAGVWCVPGVPCHHPGRYQEVCCWVGRFSWGGSRVDLTPILGTKSGSLCRGPSGSPRAFRVRVYRNAWDSTEANAGEWVPGKNTTIQITASSRVRPRPHTPRGQPKPDTSQSEQEGQSIVR